MRCSIIIRAYNAENTIKRAIKSAVYQDFPKKEFEIIVVNDGSTDKTREVINEFQGVSNIKIINQENGGGTAAANRGLKESAGDYVTILDSDDKFEPSLLKDLSEILYEKPDIDFVYSDYYESRDGQKKLVSPRHIFETVAIGILLRREKFKKEGWYKDGIFFAEYDLLLRTLGKWRGYYYPKPLFTYFRRNDSNTADKSRVAAGIEQLKKIHSALIDKIETIRSY